MSALLQEGKKQPLINLTVIKSETSATLGRQRKWLFQRSHAGPRRYVCSKLDLGFGDMVHGSCTRKLRRTSKNLTSLCYDHVILFDSCTVRADSIL